MKTVTCAILLVLAAATYLMARFEGARAVLIGRACLESWRGYSIAGTVITRSVPG